MKEIVIVSKGNNASAYGAGIEISKSASTNISANLAVLNEILKTHVPTEAGETFRIFLMDLVQGINSGYAIDYVKTGKQLDGKDLNPVDLAGYKEFYELYKDRLLNVRFGLTSYIPKMKDNKVLMDLRSKSYLILNSMATVAPVAPTVIDPDKELREMFDAQIKEAMLAKDMVLAKELMAMRNSLKAPETVSGTTGVSHEAPSFEATTEGVSIDANLDKALTGATENNSNDKPIEFTIESGNKPTWDGDEANA